MTVLMYKLPKKIEFYDDPNYLDRSSRYSNYDADDITVLTYDLIKIEIIKDHRTTIDICNTRYNDQQSRVTRNLPDTGYKLYTSDKHPLVFIDEEKDTARTAVGSLVDQKILIPTGDSSVHGSISYQLYEINTKVLNTMERIH